MKNRRPVCVLCAAFVIASAIVGRGGTARGAGARRSPAEDAAALGIFEQSGDVGAVVHAGSVAYDAGKGSYAIRGSGENMWFGKDEFQFAWKKMSGDVALTANISFPGEGKNPHRKAVLMIRKDLD